ncbi:YfhO family protein [Lactiplantibacillus daoliensis]|uniref:YfhO family protein n=1 Tax=Lactiplantibacillus daoliensis TaxID=2559916 RepID=A0ABW1UFF3_9LACO|nr:YfhO family protein [Lactiplantibacillus daoliensis]
MSKSNQTKRWLVSIAAGITSLLIMSLVFTIKGVTPFGNHNLLFSDLGGQYLSFFTAYRHALLTHSFQLYSFSQSLGGNALPTIAYYLLSPFNLLILLFPAANIPTGLTVIILIKIGIIAFTMTLFLQNHFQTEHWSIALFGVAFSLSGFVALNYFTIMWLDALIWLPLVIQGLEHLVKTGRRGPFFWWLWVSIVTDYYLGYMTCLFVVYYFITQLVTMKQPGSSFWQTVKKQRALIGRVVTTAILSGLSTLFILIPTGLGMLQTAKSAVKLSYYLPVPQFGLSAFSQLGLGANNYVTRLYHDPTVFSSTLVILLVLVYFVHPQISRQQKWHNGGLLVALLLSMEINTLNTIWHMFQRPAGFPYREAFFVSFVLVMIACEAWLARPEKIGHRWQWGLPLILGAVLTLGWFARRGTSSPLAMSTWLLSLGLVAVTAAVLFITNQRLRVLLLAGTVATELTANGVLSMQHSPLGNQATFVKAYQVEYRQMHAVNDPDGQLYRVENDNTLINQAYNYNTEYRNYNDPMLFNFHDITYYSSTFDNQTRLMLKSLGLFSKNVRRVSSEGLNPVSALLLDIKYDVTLSQNGQSTTKTMSRNGLGFTVTDAFAQLKLHANSAIDNQENILQSLLPSNTPYFAKATILSDQVTTDPKATTFHERHTIKLRLNNTGDLYYDDAAGQTKYSTMRVNGKLVPSKFNADGDLTLRDLGAFNKGDIVTLTVKRTRKTLGTHVHLAGLDVNKFIALTESLKKESFKATYHVTGTQTVVTGNVNNRSNQHWLYVTIPADRGWQVSVNGQTVETKTVLGGMLAVPITAGQNQVKLVYHVPGFRAGIAASMISLLTFGTLVYFRRKQA